MKPQSIKIIAIAHATSRLVLGLGSDGKIYQYGVQSQSWREWA